MAMLRDRVNAVEFNGRRQQLRDAAAVRENSYETIKVILIGNIVAGLLGFVALAQMLRAEKRLSAADQELRGVNRLQRAVLDGTVHSVISTTPEGVITLFSRGAEKMLGYTAGEMVGRQTPEEARAAELSVQLGRPVAAGFEAFIARARLGEADEREWTYVRKDGTRLPVQLSVTALRDDADRITGFLGIAQDLTERKRAETALRASEERLGQVLGHAECLVWEARVTLKGADWAWDMSVYPSGLHDRLNEQKMWEEEVGLWHKFDIPERSEMDRRSRAAMEEGRPGYAQEFRLIRDGKTVWLREVVSIRPQGGGVFWLVGVATDVTDRKRAEDALASSEAQFRNAFDYAGIGMALVGLDGHWLQVNQNLRHMLGYTEPELLARTFQDVTHPDDLQTCRICSPAAAAITRWKSATSTARAASCMSGSPSPSCAMLPARRGTLSRRSRTSRPATRPSRP
jgi:PAS domain S-box-containing protein